MRSEFTRLKDSTSRLKLNKSPWDQMAKRPKITSEIIEFRDKRNWAQFHNAKDLALALSIEAAELNEAFLWKKAEEAAKEKVEEELADILIYSLLLLEKYDLDFEGIIRKKIKMNSRKYPIKRAYGKSTKYSDLK